MPCYEEFLPHKIHFSYSFILHEIIFRNGALQTRKPIGHFFAVSISLISRQKLSSIFGQVRASAESAHHEDKYGFRKGQRLSSSSVPLKTRKCSIFSRKKSWYIYIYVAMVEKNRETILLSLRACTRDKSIGSLFFPLSLYSYVSSTVKRKNQYTDFLHIYVYIYTFFFWQ